LVAPPHPTDPVVLNWLERHRGPVSFTLHMIGIPPTILGAMFVPIYLSLLSYPIFMLAVVMFFGGFALQFLGHALEGSEPGEIALMRRRLARRLALAPDSRKTPQSIA
jgi:hypothetical protein